MVRCDIYKKAYFNVQSLIAYKKKSMIHVYKFKIPSSRNLIRRAQVIISNRRLKRLPFYYLDTKFIFLIVQLYFYLFSFRMYVRKPVIAVKHGIVTIKPKI